MNHVSTPKAHQLQFPFMSEVDSSLKASSKCKSNKCRKPSTMDMVREFHDLTGTPSPEFPDLNNPDLNRLRVDLLREELTELEEALQAGDAVAALDALTDIQYVLDGAYLALGFSSYKDEAFLEVQRSNMSKMGADGKPIRRDDGKIMKGPNYSEPDLYSVLFGD